MTTSRIDAILGRAKQLYCSPDRRDWELIEALRWGIGPLARIALNARYARRALRLVSIRVESARETLEGAVRAAERAAGGEPLSLEEDRAAHDEAVMEACRIEKTAGSEAAADAGRVARYAAGCVCDAEWRSGEHARNAHWSLEFVIRDWKDADWSPVSLRDEHRAVEDDLHRLLLYAEDVGEPWIDPRLDQGLFQWLQRDDWGWTRMLEAEGLPAHPPSPAASPGELRDRWQRIHQAVRRRGGQFYPPNLFGPL
jgi:hypothetical protein